MYALPARIHNQAELGLSGRNEMIDHIDLGPGPGHLVGILEMRDA